MGCYQMVVAIRICLWYVVLLRGIASQIKRKESNMQYYEILEIVIAELTERGYKRQQSENPEVNDWYFGEPDSANRCRNVFPTSAGRHRISWRNTMSQ